MADRKISEFAKITGSLVDASKDSIPVVDESAGSSLAGNKRITVSELMKLAPVQPDDLAAEANARIAGDTHLMDQVSAIAGGSAITTENSFATRGAFVSWASSAAPLVDGTTITAAGLVYIRQAGATAIPDLPGWVPGGRWSVAHFGAGGGGDDVSAFSSAAQSAPASDNITQTWSGLAHAVVAEVIVPAGSYILTSDLVDTGGREISWIVDRSARITDASNINGRVVREGRVTHRHPNGTLDQTAGGVFSVGGNWDDKPAPVTGVTTTQGAADYTQRDAVGLVGSGYASPALIDVDVATYTTTTVTIAAPSARVKKRLRAGMVIYTKHSTRCAGILTSWNTDGSVLTVSDGWRAKGGSGSVTPEDGTGLTIGVDKVWGMNAVVNLSVDGFATQGIGTEISARNQRGAPTADIEDKTNRMWGVLAATNALNTSGYYQGQVGFMARGGWIYGFCSQDQDVGFYYHTSRSDVVGAKLRLHYDAPAVQVLDQSDNETFRLRTAGDLFMGNPAGTNPRHISWRTGGFGNTYDVRLQASGGADGNNGAGALSIIAAGGVTSYGNIVPLSGSTLRLGSATQMWNEGYIKTIHPGAGAVKWTSGAGSPEGVLSAAVGSMYTRTDGGAGTTLYVKESGTSNTGWVAK